jgi:uncharacterized protein
MALRAKKWERLARSPSHGAFLLPILALVGDNAPLGLDREDEAGIAADAPELLRSSILGIADYWDRHRPHRAGILLDAVDGGSRPVRPPGRNDPCPCGSNKKYKKCCGGVHAAA